MTDASRPHLGASGQGSCPANKKPWIASSIQGKRVPRPCGRACIFFHPDYTVGSEVPSDRLVWELAGCNRRWGIAPRPEDVSLTGAHDDDWSLPCQVAFPEWVDGLIRRTASSVGRPHPSDGLIRRVVRLCWPCMRQRPARFRCRRRCAPSCRAGSEPRAHGHRL